MNQRQFDERAVNAQVRFMDILDKWRAHWLGDRMEVDNGDQLGTDVLAGFELRSGEEEEKETLHRVFPS